MPVTSSKETAVAMGMSLGGRELYNYLGSKDTIITIITVSEVEEENHCYDYLGSKDTTITKKRSLRLKKRIVVIII